MKSIDRSILLILLALAGGASGACDRAGEGGDEAETVATPEPQSESAKPAEAASDPSCPSQEEVASAIGFPVQSKPWGMGCYYETPDFEASVSIMRILAGQADQVEREMRESAEPYGAEVAAIEVGDRGHAWTSPAQSQAYAVSGDHGWLLDFTTPGSSGADNRAAVVEVLEMMID